MEVKWQRSLPLVAAVQLIRDLVLGQALMRVEGDVLRVHDRISLPNLAEPEALHKKDIALFGDLIRETSGPDARFVAKAWLDHFIEFLLLQSAHVSHIVHGIFAPEMSLNLKSLA
jgi:hypothetical protein